MSEQRRRSGPSFALALDAHVGDRAEFEKVLEGFLARLSAEIKVSK